MITTNKKLNFSAIKNDDLFYDIKCKIRRLRLNILVHSSIYYEFCTSVISDDKWQEWANELVVLQRDNPSCLDIGIYDEDFKVFDGSTGYYLDIKSDYAKQKAMRLINENSYIKNKIISNLELKKDELINKYIDNLSDNVFNKKLINITSVITNLKQRNKIF